MSARLGLLRHSIARQTKLLRPYVFPRTSLQSPPAVGRIAPLMNTLSLGSRNNVRSFSRSAIAREEAATADSASPREQQPAYEMTFTCKKCETRSTHRISKQGYHKGTVLVQCPGCKSRHLISDHLKIFSDKQITLEDILKEKGQLLKKGELSSDGDVEFWDDGTQTTRKSEQATEG